MRDAGFLIFDCDGVLIDSEPLANTAWAEVLNEHGFPVTPEDLAGRFTGVTDRSMAARLAEQFGRPVPREVASSATARLLARYERELGAIEGIARLLDADDRPRAVASSSTPDKLMKGLEVTGLVSRFGRHIYSASLVPRGKPWPDLFLHVAAELGGDPADCVVVEDSRAGVEAGVRAGMRVIGFAGGSHCREGHGAALIAAGAVTAVASADELAALIR